MNRESTITHLQIIQTWAEFALEHGQFLSSKHLENIVSWTEDAVALLKRRTKEEADG